MSEEPKYIRKLEEDIENLRRETKTEMESLRKQVASEFMLFYQFFRAVVNFISSTTPRTKEKVIAEFRFMREFHQAIMQWGPEEEMKSEITNDFKALLVDTLRSGASIPFDDMVDVLLRGLGRDLTSEWISKNLIAELWGAKALERFNEMLSD